MSIVQIETLHCIICKNSVVREHHSQMTCLREKCQYVLRKQNKKKRYSKISPNSKTCKCCAALFVTKNPIKKYCSVKCAKKIKKIRSKKTGLLWIRKKNNTLEKYASILRENGYIVLEKTE